jgi:hypothetical protein
MPAVPMSALPAAHRGCTQPVPAVPASKSLLGSLQQHKTLLPTTLLLVYYILFSRKKKDKKAVHFHDANRHLY